MNSMKFMVGLLLIVVGVFIGSFVSVGGHSGALLGGWLGGMLWCSPDCVLTPCSPDRCVVSYERTTSILYLTVA
jgi:hypothetical protein